jgi:hypothetical protein
MVATAAAVDGAKVLSGNPGGSDVATLVAGVDDGDQARPAGVDEVFSATAQHPPYPVERLIGAPAVSVGLLLDATAHVIDAGDLESHDMEWVERRTAVGGPADSAAQ